MRLKMKARQEVTAVTAGQYRGARKREKRVLLDQFYARHWSPWLDVFVMAKTVITLIKREGAY